MSMSLPAIYRIVTGHDKNGKAIVSSQGRLPTVVEIAAVRGTVFHEVWSTAGSPAAIDNGIDPTLKSLTLLPPKSGTRVRFVDFPPETPMFRRMATKRPRTPSRRSATWRR
jgi:naringenin degradation protein FdeH